MNKKKNQYWKIKQYYINKKDDDESSIESELAEELKIGKYFPNNKRIYSTNYQGE